MRSSTLLLLAGISIVTLGGLLLLSRSSNADQESVAPAESTALPPFTGLFVGEINGFAFYDRSLMPTTTPGSCPAPTSASLPEEISAAALDFTPAYLIPGMQLTSESGATCAGEVTSISKAFALQGAGHLSILRRKSLIPYPAAHRRADMQAATIGGKPAVVVTEQSGPSQLVKIYMREDANGLWYVAAFQIEKDEVLRIAESLR